MERRRDQEIGKTKVSKTLCNGDGGRGNASEPGPKGPAQNIPSPAHRSHLDIWEGRREDGLPA